MEILSNDHFVSRRSCVLSTGGMVASSQTLASMAGVDILRLGGNAADAAIATAAALQVTQPCSTGLGGDCFALYFNDKDQKVYAMNGSGRAGSRLNAERLKKEGFENRIPHDHAYCVTIPGAPAAWFDFHERFGKLSLEKVLASAIELAENGFPVSQYTALWWQDGAKAQLSKHRFGHELMIEGRGPYPGEIVRLSTLADSLKTLAVEGKTPFYQGEIAEKIVAAVNEAGGDLVLKDLVNHRTDWVEPIGLEFADKMVWECPPNGQGLAALIALNVVKHLELQQRNSVERYHQLIQAMRIGFADAAAYNGDPEFSVIPVQNLLSAEYGRKRSKEIDLTKMTVPQAGVFDHTQSVGTDTVYFCTADKEGNACSFINSNFIGFGSGIVPQGCGYSLQNRGHGFVLTKGHRNELQPGKRPYHTIIPGMITNKDNSLHSTFGVMGGWMQPQGHLQVLVSLLQDNVDPQAALDGARFQLEDGLPAGKVWLESPLEGDIANGLKELGHEIIIINGHDRHLFGIGQIIMKVDKGTAQPVLWAASDSRGDGCAIGHT